MTIIDKRPPVLATDRTPTAAQPSPTTFPQPPAVVRPAFDAPLPSVGAFPVDTRGAANIAADAIQQRARVRAPTTNVTTGAQELATRAAFEAFAKRDNVPGAANVLAVKFLIVDVDTASPQVWLIDTNEHAYHYDFASNALGMPVDLATFNNDTYFTDNRKNIAGTIVAHDSYLDSNGDKGAYAIEFWPTDPVKATHVGKAFELLAGALPFTEGHLAYHPAGDTQEALARDEAAQLESLRVPLLSTDQLFAGVTYSPLNPGVGFGTLRVIDDAASLQTPLTSRDVALFTGSLPNDISHVGGIISETPQTPLSHINLKAQQNQTPNAYVKNASTDPEIAGLIGKLVRYEVGPNGMNIREATRTEADAWLEAQRPKDPQTAPRDLSVKTIRAFDTMGVKDAAALGAKSANIAEMRKFLPLDMIPDGFGIPFSFYDDFMSAKDATTGKSLYDDVQALMADPAFKGDPAAREEMLDGFRRKVRRAKIPDALAAQITELQSKFPVDQAIRCRSSTNNEDLVGFNGAGLYDSYTHRPDEGNLGDTIKQVWAGLWTFRAFEERDFWKIDHLTAAMGVAVHVNSDDETANGVAITKNIFDANWPGFYVNVQVGESLVTNPDPKATPDEMLISAIGPNGEYEVQRIRKSSVTTNGAPVLNDDQTKQLVDAMEKIQAHFTHAYGRDLTISERNGGRGSTTARAALLAAAESALERIQDRGRPTSSVPTAPGMQTIALTNGETALINEADNAFFVRTGTGSAAVHHGPFALEPAFAMDIEFKILSNGALWVKQARPVVS